MEGQQFDKHFFILSDAGKPIYSRHGDEEKLVTLFGVMQALISFVQGREGNKLRFVKAGDSSFAFITKGPLMLVAVSSKGEGEYVLAQQLSYVYDQIVSVLTYSQIAKILDQQSNYDLRRLLSGTEKYIDHISDRFEDDPGFMLEATRCLALPVSLRQRVHGLVSGVANDKILFSLVVVGNELVAIYRPKPSYSLEVRDLTVLLTLLQCSLSNFIDGESWLPICLPHFNDSGFVHAHVSMLDSNLNTCLVLMSVEREAFFELSAARAAIQAEYDQSQFGPIREKLKLLLLNHGASMNPLLKPGSPQEVPGLYHFLFKSKTHRNQYTAPRLTKGNPYYDKHDDIDKRRLFATYCKVRHSLLDPANGIFNLFFSSSREIVYGIVTPAYELYCCFNPFISKQLVINGAQKVLDWVKAEEDKLFIVKS